MSNSLDPDLGQNCLPRLSADDTGRQRVKYMLAIEPNRLKNVRSLQACFFNTFFLTKS